MDDEPRQADEHAAALITRLDKIAGLVRCPICRQTEWDFAGLTVAMPHPDREGVVVLPLICRNCGYVRQHSANHLEHRDRE